MDDMELGELQRAALAPYRWERLLHKHSVSGDDSGNSTLLVSNLVLPAYSVNIGSNEGREGSSKFFLIPGGRFLLCLNTSHRFIRLWDIGVSGRPLSRNPILITSIDLPPNVSHLRGWAICDVGDGRIRIVTDHFLQDQIDRTM